MSLGKKPPRAALVPWVPILGTNTRPRCTSPPQSPPTPGPRVKGDRKLVCVWPRALLPQLSKGGRQQSCAPQPHPSHPKPSALLPHDVPHPLHPRCRWQGDVLPFLPWRISHTAFLSRFSKESLFITTDPRGKSPSLFLSPSLTLLQSGQEERKFSFIATSSLLQAPLQVPPVLLHP